MAKAPSKQSAPPELPPVADIVTNAIGPGLGIEDMIADQILDDIDWSKVRSALLKKAGARFFKWFQSQLLPTDGSPMITNEIEAIALSEGANDA